MVVRKDYKIRGARTYIGQGKDYAKYKKLEKSIYGKGKHSKHKANKSFRVNRKWLGETQFQDIHAQSFVNTVTFC